MKALIISADNFEDSELLYPYYRIKEEGWTVDVAAARMGQITGKHGYSVTVDKTFEEVDPAQYDLLVIPGGKAPEEVRLSKDALRIVKSFFADDKYVASICHGPQVLISAGEIAGKSVTCWQGIKDDIIAAGGRYHDTEVVLDGNLISSRKPDDLPAFMREVVSVMRELSRLETGKRKIA